MVNDPSNEPNREISAPTPVKSAGFRGRFAVALLGLAVVVAVGFGTHHFFMPPQEPLRSTIAETEARPHLPESEAVPAPRRGRERFSRRRRHAAENGRDVEVRAAILRAEKRIDVLMRPVIVNGSIVAAPMDVEIFDMWGRSIARAAVDEDFRSVHRAQSTFTIPVTLERIKVVVTYSDDATYAEEVDLRPERAREASDR